MYEQAYATIGTFKIRQIQASQADITFLSITYTYACIKHEMSPFYSLTN